MCIKCPDSLNVLVLAALAQSDLALDVKRAPVVDGKKVLLTVSIPEELYISDVVANVF